MSVARFGQLTSIGSNGSVIRVRNLQRPFIFCVDTITKSESSENLQTVPFITDQKFSEDPDLQNITD